MDDGRLSIALERAEQALARIERSMQAKQRAAGGREAELRARVKEAVAELDQIIRTAEA